MRHASLADIKATVEQCGYVHFRHLDCTVFLVDANGNHRLVDGAQLRRLSAHICKNVTADRNRKRRRTQFDYRVEEIMTNFRFSACSRCHHARCVCTSVPISRRMLGEIFEDYLRLAGSDPDRKVRLREVKRALESLKLSKP